MAEAWVSYTAILPATAGEVQRLETRRAFYAGAQAFLGLLCGQIDPGPDQPTAADLDVLDRLQAELLAFAADVGTEREG